MALGHLAPLGLDGACQPLVGCAHASGKVVVDHRRAVGADGADGELGVAGRSDFASQGHVEGQTEDPGHLGGSHHPTPRNAEDEAALAADAPCLQVLAEAPARLHAVTEPRSRH